MIGSRCSEKNVRNWINGKCLPEMRYVNTIERVLFGVDKEFDGERLKLREARDIDRKEKQVNSPSPFQAFGSMSGDPYSYTMPVDAGDCYETLFPNALERDDFEDILSWLKGAQDDASEWSELFCTFQERGACIGVAFLSLHRPSGWWFGNYFGILRDWREDDRAAKFLAFILARCEFIEPTAKGIIFEVERFDKKHIEAVLAKCDAKIQWKKDDKIDLSEEERLSVEAALRISLYTVHGLARATTDYNQSGDIRSRLPGALALFCESHDGPCFLEHIQPSIDQSLDPSREVPLWLMIYPLPTMMTQLSITSIPPEGYKLGAAEADDIFDFLYDHVFTSSYAREHKSRISAGRGFDAYVDYVRGVRQKVNAGFRGRSLLLVKQGILPKEVRRLFGRYGQRRLRSEKKPTRNNESK
jgi:hypothetical protein